MKGDFSSSKFDSKKHYTGVRMQQGRVQLDADWNEQMDMFNHRVQTQALDFIGGSGTPEGHDGYAISVVGEAGITISNGRYYVNGLLCEREEEELEYINQPDYPNALLPTTDGLYLAYLDAWQRGVSTTEDEDIREVALNGVDTTTRIQNVAQVKLLKLPGNDFTTFDCATVFNEDANSDSSAGVNIEKWKDVTAKSSGKLVARVNEFANLTNQLYRVEINRGGDINQATFKWSRDNAYLSVTVEDLIINSDGNDGEEIAKIKVAFLRETQRDEFQIGDWIELTNKENELNQVPGNLVRIADIEGDLFTLDRTLDKSSSLSIARRWDGYEASLIVGPGQNTDGYLSLENGIKIKFEGEGYRTGDYWLIHARKITNDISWKTDEKGEPLALSPQGVAHSYAKLALLRCENKNWTVLDDCRKRFFAAPSAYLAAPQAPAGSLYVDRKGQVNVRRLPEFNNNQEAVKSGLIRNDIYRNHDEVNVVNTPFLNSDIELIEANNDIENYRVSAQVAPLQNGNFVVVRQTGFHEISVQRYDRNGSPIGIILQINIDPGKGETLVSLHVKSWSDGRFLVVYGLGQRTDPERIKSMDTLRVYPDQSLLEYIRNEILDFSITSVFACVYDKDGKEIGGAEELTGIIHDYVSDTSETNKKPTPEITTAVSTLGGNEFVVAVLRAWNGRNSTGSKTGDLVAYRYSCDKNTDNNLVDLKLISKVTITSETEASGNDIVGVFRPIINDFQNGEYTISWAVYPPYLRHDETGKYNLWEVWSCRVGNNNVRSEPVKVIDRMSGLFFDTTLLDNGRLLYAWSLHSNNGYQELYAQECASDDKNGLSLVGLPITVSSYGSLRKNTPHHQAVPRCTALSDGGFVIVWLEEETHRFYGRKYNNGAKPVTPQFLINEDIKIRKPDRHCVVDLLDSNVLVLWEGEREDRYGLYQKYVPSSLSYKDSISAKIEALNAQVEFLSKSMKELDAFILEDNRGEAFQGKRVLNAATLLNTPGFYKEGSNSERLGGYVHFKLPLNVYTTPNSTFFRIHVHGYAHGSGEIVDVTMAGYCFVIKNEIASRASYGSHEGFIYHSDNGDIYCRLTFRDPYYVDLVVDTYGKLSHIIRRGEIKIIVTQKEEL